SAMAPRKTSKAMVSMPDSISHSMYACTFINAFELSPVHCLKSCPSGNRRRPGNGETAEILESHNVMSDEAKKQQQRNIVPAINVFDNFQGIFLCMLHTYIC